jgi:dihydroneopterin aldolase
MPSEIHLRGFRTHVNLGCQEVERAHQQEVRMNISLRWVSFPKACWSDDLRDTFCYVALMQYVRVALQSKEFFLIEYLSYYIYQSVRAFIAQYDSLSDDILLRVEIIKTAPVEDLQEATFLCSDW